MKKIILLILPFFLTGCFDYQELNNLAIISGISIDYVGEQFEVSYEILNSKKQEGSDSGSTNKTYYVESEGETLQEAFKNVNLTISKEPYFAHVKVILFSEEVARAKMDDVIDFLIRNPNIRNIFVPVLAINSTAKEILNSPTPENPVTSESIHSMIETSKSYENIAIKQDFETFVDLLLDPRKDAYMNTIEEQEGNIKLTGIGAFKKTKLITLLNQTESGVFNVLNNTSYNHYVKLACPDNKEKYSTIDLYDNQHSSIEYQNGVLKVQSKLTASIIADECHYDFRSSTDYKELEQRFNKEVEKEYKELLTKIQKNQTDILQINNNYYKKNRKDLTNWYNIPLEFEINVNINKNGLIFQVNNDE